MEYSLQNQPLAVFLLKMALSIFRCDLLIENGIPHFS